MARTEYYRTAITFALNQKRVIEEINKRERDGYAPIGVNIRRIYSNKFKRSFMRISFDFYKRNENQNIREDILVWLDWNKKMALCCIHYSMYMKFLMV